ncbi:MAG TPA: M17 family peptidase N-terminal domain-containing protein, partial [Actinomycetota bacterium]|nr:M17 family peptidase N-terminal domain-containing protein [Actinomycetota bacterium]
MPQILPSEEAGESLTHASCDALLLGAFSSAGSFELDETGRRIDAALDSALSRYLENSDFKGKASSIATLPTLGRIPARTVVVAGLGPRSSVTTTEVRKAAGNAVRRVANEGILISALHLAVPGDDAASASVEGLLLGSYRFNRYKSEPEQSSISEIRLPQASAHAVDRGRIYAEAAALARDLANEPPAALTPKLLARRAEDVAR